jgi:amino acid adenylation domain-containing protein
LIEEQVARTPDAVALDFAGAHLTYRQLDTRANKLAHRLRSLGVGPNVLVGLSLERSLEMVVSLLAILKAGGAYVPIDPDYPAGRRSFMLQDARVPLLLTQQALLAKFAQHEVKLLCVDREWDKIEKEDERAPGVAISPSDIAYTIYTSGSTGKPKGVQIEHRAVVNFLQSMRRKPGLGAKDVLLAITTLSFDIAGLELYLPLITGAKIVLAGQEAAVDGETLLQLIERHQVSILQATPATWRLMLAAGWKGSPSLKALCGGEALPADLAAELLPRCAELWNMYGPTETTIWSTCARVTDAMEIHIGRPIDNTDIYILDARGEPLPIGVAGELLIGGAGVARGYLNCPELTAEKFVPHPFKPGERLYRTGDLARYRNDGNVNCLGRLDFQVKVRGFRIELGEIEAQLAAHPQVKQTVVLAREDTPGDPRLVAYLVARSPAEPPQSGALREHLRGRLPEYMIPAAFMVLDALPLTPNGKIDRKSLPAPEKDSGVAACDVISPRNPTEQRVAAIFAEVLRTRVASVNDNFFDLGGHSLNVVQLQARVDRALGVRLPIRDLFQAATVAELAVLVDRANAGPPALTAGRPVGEETGLI